MIENVSKFKCLRIILRNRSQEFCPLVCNATQFGEGQNTTLFTVTAITTSNPNRN
jgi:hypothetical protein